MSKPKSKKSETPLRMHAWFGRDASGKVVGKTLLRRGLLKVALTCSLPDGYVLEAPPVSAKVQLENAARAMRELLKQAGIPNDEHFIWIREGTGKWRPDEDIEKVVPQPYELRRWNEQMQSVTEVMSINRLRGEFLHALNEVLRQPWNEDELGIVLAGNHGSSGHLEIDQSIS